MDTMSTTQKQWRYVTQIIHFVGGVVRTFHNIDTTTIQDWQLCKMRDEKWRLIMVNKDNVLLVEVLSSDT